MNAHNMSHVQVVMQYVQQVQHHADDWFPWPASIIWFPHSIIVSKGLPAERLRFRDGRSMQVQDYMKT